MWSSFHFFPCTAPNFLNLIQVVEVFVHLQSQGVIVGSRAWLADWKHDGWNYCGKHCGDEVSVWPTLKLTRRLCSHNSCAPANVFRAHKYQPVVFYTFPKGEVFKSGNIVGGWQILHQWWHHCLDITDCQMRSICYIIAWLHNKIQVKCTLFLQINPALLITTENRAEWIKQQTLNSGRMRE